MKGRNATTNQYKYMKKYLAVLSAAMVFIAGGGLALAAPNNAENNPQIVANYPDGDHGIVGEPFKHTGSDVVMKTGDNGNFQQWFYGFSEQEGGIIEGDHSLWKVSKDGTCPNDKWVLVEEPYPEWGDYLEPGVDYCVLTNDYHVVK